MEQNTRRKHFVACRREGAVHCDNSEVDIVTDCCSSARVKRG